MEEAASAVMVPGLAMRFRMPLLLVETFTEMSGEAHPLGLTRLSLCEFFVAASRIPSAPGRNSGGGLTHIEATLASLLLENLLPCQLSGLFRSTVVITTFHFLSVQILAHLS